MQVIKSFILPALGLLAALLPTTAAAAEPVQVSHEGVAARDAVAVVGTDGARTVAWLERSGNGQSPLVFSRLGEDGTPGPVTDVAGAGNARNPVLVALPDGVVMALWGDGRAQEQIVTAYIHPDGTSEIGPAVADGSNYGDLDAVATADGTTTVVWSSLIKVKGQDRLHQQPRFARISLDGHVTKSKWLARGEDDITDVLLAVSGENTVLAAWEANDDVFDRTTEVFTRGINSKGKLQKRGQRPFKNVNGSETIDSLDGNLLAATSARKNGSRTLLTGAFGGKDGTGKFRKGSRISIPTGEGVKEPDAALAHTGDGGWLVWKDAGGVHVGPVDLEGTLGDVGTLTGVPAGWKSAIGIGPGFAPTVAYATRTAGPEAATLQPDAPEVAEQLLTGGNGARVTPIVAAGPQTAPAIVWETADKRVFVATG